MISGPIKKLEKIPGIQPRYYTERYMLGFITSDIRIHIFCRYMPQRHIQLYIAHFILSDIKYIPAEYMYSYIARYKTKHISFSIIPN